MPEGRRGHWGFHRLAYLLGFIQHAFGKSLSIFKNNLILLESTFFPTYAPMYYLLGHKLKHCFPLCEYESI